MKRQLKKSTTKKTELQDKHIYTMDVFIISGPISGKFIKKNPVIARTIEILGDQTLADLHNIIFEAFDREEEHLYEFQIGGKCPQDPKAKRYGLPDPDEFGHSKQAELANSTNIGSLNLKVGSMFGYWFDFGDDWWHQISVIDIREDTGALKSEYPKVIKCEGASPPQYSDWNEEK